MLSPEYEKQYILDLLKRGCILFRRDRATFSINGYGNMGVFPVERIREMQREGLISLQFDLVTTAAPDSS